MKTSEGLELALATEIGRFFIVFSHVELNLGLYVLADDPASDWDNFGPKVEALKKRCASWEPQIRGECMSWCKRASDIRGMRNKFAHGRWVVRPVQSEIVLLLSPFTPGETYSIQGLQDITLAVEKLGRDFLAIQKFFPN